MVTNGDEWNYLLVSSNMAATSPKYINGGFGGKIV